MHREKLELRWRQSADVAVLHVPAGRSLLEPGLAKLAETGSASLVVALRALLDGQRDEAVLCDPLEREDTLIVMTILRCLADTAVAEELLGPET